MFVPYEDEIRNEDEIRKIEKAIHDARMARIYKALEDAQNSKNKE